MAQTTTTTTAAPSRLTIRQRLQAATAMLTEVTADIETFFGVAPSTSGGGRQRGRPPGTTTESAAAAAAAASGSAAEPNYDDIYQAISSNPGQTRVQLQNLLGVTANAVGRLTNNLGYMVRKSVLRTVGEGDNRTYTIVPGATVPQATRSTRRRAAAIAA